MTNHIWIIFQPIFSLLELERCRYTVKGNKLNRFLTYSHYFGKGIVLSSRRVSIENNYPDQISDTFSPFRAAIHLQRLWTLQSQARWLDIRARPLTLTSVPQGL